jgi:tRNA threonylcarbamoyladenosine biosynthesis protein TsaE
VQWEKIEEAELCDLAERVAGVIGPGDVVVLAGEIGSGKSTFVRAAARALGVKEAVTSPTYQIAREYEGRLRVNHLDLYRLEEIGAEDALDLDGYLDPHAVTFIEWAEPALGLLESPTIIELAHHGENARRVKLEGPVEQRMRE